VKLFTFISEWLPLMSTTQKLDEDSMAVFRDRFLKTVTVPAVRSEFEEAFDSFRTAPDGAQAEAKAKLLGLFSTYELKAKAPSDGFLEGARGSWAALSRGTFERAAAKSTKDHAKVLEEKQKAIVREARISSALRLALGALEGIDLAPVEKTELCRRFAGALGAHGVVGATSSEAPSHTVVAVPARVKAAKPCEQKTLPAPAKKIRSEQEAKLMHDVASNLQAVKAAAKLVPGGKLEQEHPLLQASRRAITALSEFRSKQRAATSETTGVAPAGEAATRCAAASSATPKPPAPLKGQGR
jgi:hypothetical protein